MTKTWDGDAFRARMRTAARNAQTYSDEHNDRLRRGQANGRASVRDEYFGESVICDTLSTSAATASPSSLLVFLDEHEKYIEEERATLYVDDKEAYRRGYKSRINQVRAEVKTYL